MKPRHIEDQHQSAYFRWVDAMAKQDDRYLLIYHPANGGKRSVFEAERLRRQGVRAGVPDIIVDVPTPFWAGLRIELKRPWTRGKGERKPETRPEQQAMLARMQQAGHVACLCYGWEQARAATLAYMTGQPVPHQFEADR